MRLANMENNTVALFLVKLPPPSQIEPESFLLIKPAQVNASLLIILGVRPEDARSKVTVSKVDQAKSFNQENHPMQVVASSWMPLQEKCTLNFKVTSTQKKLLVQLMLSKPKQEMMVL